MVRGKSYVRFQHIRVSIHTCFNTYVFQYIRVSIRTYFNTYVFQYIRVSMRGNGPDFCR